MSQNVAVGRWQNDAENLKVCFYDVILSVCHCNISVDLYYYFDGIKIRFSSADINTTGII